MAKASGQVLERHWKSGRGYALRFVAYGKRQYLTLGLEGEGWNPKRAEEELQNILADVRRGIWVPPQRGRRRREEAGEAPLFGLFARELVASRKGQVSESTLRSDEWALAHLLPYFADLPLPGIDAEAVDAYRNFKVTESEARRRAIERRAPLRNEQGQALRPLAPSSINKTIDTLQWILSVALDYKHVTENAAAGKRRRLRTEQRRPVHLDTAAQIEALLDAAAELDRDPRLGCSERRAIIATLILAGPRAHELGYLLWRDVDLANGRISIGRSKTQAGLREIKMAPILRDILATHKASAFSCGPEDLVFPTGTGGRRNKDNLRVCVLLATFARADELLERRGHVPLPKGLSAHKLRHTFASVLIACGEDPASVMAQLGHTDPGFTLRVYTHAMSRDPGERARLKGLVAGERASEEPPPSPPGLLPYSAYELPILRALAKLGGSAPRRAVVGVVRGRLGGRLGDLDCEALPCGTPRWEMRIDVTRKQLIQRGWLRADSRRGIWELAPAGVERLRRAKRGRGQGGSPRARLPQEARSK
ncbi:MAG: tyrosine-type recombinase/integrase [Solirubrobacterales bacterium]|nr:tyrosine-type recombinase/integrase [Solirubrobacterales bacterium]